MNQSADRKVIDNATLWIGDGQCFDGHVVVSGQRIEAVERGRYGGDLPVTDLGGMALSPGLIDIMVGGAFDLSLLHDDQVEVARQYLALGVTAFQTTLGTVETDDWPRLAGKCRAGMAYEGLDASRNLGALCEGPFYDAQFIGANNAALVWPATPADVDRFLEVCGDIARMVNVSPGIEGDVEAVRTLHAAGKIVEMSHSGASAERVTACVDAGISQVGHMWNNNQSSPAEPGVQQPTVEHVTLTDDRVRFIHLITDGTHVHPMMIDLTIKCRGLGSICVVSDAINRAGVPDGPFTFDSGLEAEKVNGVGRLPSGQLAGSARLLPDDFRHFVNVTGILPHVAIQTVTRNAAQAAAVDDEIGMLSPGLCADFAAWDDGLRVRRGWRGGREVDAVGDLMEVAYAGQGS